MVWNKQHDGADLDEKLHRLRQDPFDLAPRKITVSEDYLVALEAKVIRSSGILYSSRELTNGVIDPAVVPMISANAQVRLDRVMGAIEALVRVDLLRRRTKRDGGGWEIPNIQKYNPSKEQVQLRKAAESRLAWLQNTKLGRQVRDFIKERDGHRCRYCYVELPRNDQKSNVKLSYDHVRPLEPEYDRDPDFIVLACGFHNGMKLNRAPEDAGLTLLPPWGSAECDEAQRVKAKERQEIALIVASRLSEQDPDPETIIAAVNETLKARSQARKAAADQNATERRPNRDSTSSSGRVGSGRDGSALDGPGLDGSGRVGVGVGSPDSSDADPDDGLGGAA